MKKQASSPFVQVSTTKLPLPSHLEKSAFSGRDHAAEPAPEKEFFASFLQKRRPCLLPITIAALFYSSVSHAHAFLESAMPRVGSTIPTPPTEIVLTFTQGVEAVFSKLELTDQAGTHEETGAAHNEGAGKEKLAVSVNKLAAGTYLVSWHVTSVDTHKTQGKFKFTVAPSR